MVRGLVRVMGAGSLLQNTQERGCPLACWAAFDAVVGKTAKLSSQDK